MHKLRHFYYQNKEKIWKVVLIIAFLLGIIYYINNSLEKQSNEVKEESQKDNTLIYSNKENKTYISDTSAIYGEKVTEKEAETINNNISKFLQYCKNGNVELAYQMVSKDCKSNNYSTVEKFQEKYIKPKFNKSDIYEIEKWEGNTYKITISKDILATGNINSSKKVEYITIVKEGTEKKLNINGYIEKEEINKEITKNDVKITVVNKQTYMDYEIYNFKIQNQSNKTIKMDTLDEAKSMYIEDKNGNTYNSYSYEILENDLEIRSNHEVNLQIKYAKNYSAGTRIKNIVFKNVILDYIKYRNTENVQDFESKCEIAINLD